VGEDGGKETCWMAEADERDAEGGEAFAEVIDGDVGGADD
jgi:hypothetical protein